MWIDNSMGAEVTKSTWKHLSVLFHILSFLICQQNFTAGTLRMCQQLSLFISVCPLCTDWSS